MPKLSVIIATHNRVSTLAKCLEYLEKQTMAEDLEVIVISDGPDDAARTLCERDWNVAVRYDEVPKSQQGVARNRGVQLAEAPLCLFINDDILLAPDACAVHLHTHSSHPEPIAILGHTTWDPAMSITPVMQWLEQSGWQFGYNQLKPEEFASPDTQHQFTYASHISLPTSIASEVPFRQDATLYGWEDVEWGLRLKEAGIRLYYAPRAKALHHHHLTLADSLVRVETIGRSAPHFAKINPQFDRVPKGWKRLAYQLSALLPTMDGKHRKAFLRGLKKQELR